MRQQSTFRLIQFFSIALLLLAPLLSSAQIYKCMENGSVTFQSDPCKTAGTQMRIDAGPSEHAVRDAQNRANRDKKSAWEKPASPPPNRISAVESHPPDCEKLNRAVSDAEGQRNQLIVGAMNPGATDAGMRNINRRGAQIDQQYNNAKVMADVTGCQ